MKSLRRSQFAFRVVVIFLIPVLACTFITGAPEEEAPAADVSKAPTITDTPEATWTPTLTPTRTLIPTSTVDPIASSFGDTILDAIRDRQPIFQDDFSNNHGWDVHTDNTGVWLLSLSDGFIQTLNDGGSSYIHIRNRNLDTLQNFVMMVDAAFIESSSMPRDRAIGVCWWPGDDLGERFLLYESGKYLGGTCHDNECPDFVNGRVEPIAVEQFVSLILIHRRGESVVYVNGRSVAYHKLSINSQHGSFSLCPHTFDGKQTDIKYDNVRVWSLYRVPGLP